MPHQHLHPERITDRVIRGLGDHGEEEIATIWLEYLPGAIYRVCRVVNIEERDLPAAREADHVFEGYELDDALTAINEAIEAELDASAGEDARNADVRPVTRHEVEPYLERLLTR